jgi:DNA-binding beta-propeller fold protein YncE
MSRRCRFSSVLVVVGFLALVLSAHAQVVTATVPVGDFPGYVAVNPVTNTIYEANAQCGAIPPCPTPGTVTVINGANNAVIGTVNVGVNPGPLAVNTVTNKIYVTNFCGYDTTCQSLGTVTVIDGTTLQTSSVTTGYAPYNIAVNPVTNEIYVANQCIGPFSSNGCEACTNQMNGTITVIDGSTLVPQTIQEGCGPVGLAVNSTTNTIYVVNTGNNTGLNLNGTVAVINGATLSVQNVPIGIVGAAVAVDATRNMIYATDVCGNDPTCQSGGNLTAINGTTLTTQTVAVGFQARSVTVNPGTNKVYVGNLCGNSSCSVRPTATVVDGTTLSTTAVPVCSSTLDNPIDVEVNTVTNQVYLPCDTSTPGMGGHTVTDLDGASNTTFPIAVGDNPLIAINSTTNNIYVTNFNDATVSVIGGATKAQLFAVAPCRLIDTRQNDDPIMGGTSRSFAIPQLGGCNIPATAIAYSLNVTVVPNTTLGYLTIWPTSQIQPVVSTLNSPDGRIKANAAIVPAGVGGAVSVYVTDTTNVILDIDGYFAPSTSQTLQFYPLMPCRVVDTRQTNFPQGLGAPSFHAMEARELPVFTNSPCFQVLTMTPLAYSFNVTVVPSPAGQPLGYLTIWPSDKPQPDVSTLNNPTATVVANAAIVPAAANGDVSVFTYNSSDVIIDVNGYFDPPSAGFSFYPVPPCRVLDTRAGNGPFSGMLNPPVNVPASPCGPPQAQGYVFNATAVPSPTLGYLTLWPDTEMQPTVSTLNAYDGFITSNMAIIPDVNGNIDAYTQGTTQLILDISGFFAP